MKANFVIHAVNCFTVWSKHFAIEIEFSKDGSCIRYRDSYLISPLTGETGYDRVSRWQKIRSNGKRSYFIHHGRREFLDGYTRV